jgi:DNA-binding beta-propeller fold protein YncE
VDRDNKECTVFDKSGKFVRKFGQFNRPHGVAVNDDYVYVTDGHHHSVNVYDIHGTFHFAFGSFGNGDGQLKLPWGVVCDKEGNILVADQGNKRIQVFNSDGEFLYKFSVGGGPYGVCVDEVRGQIYVSDMENKIHKF